MEVSAPMLIRPVNRETMAMIAMATSNFQRMLQDILAIYRASGRVVNRNDRGNIPSSRNTDERPKPAIANKDPALPNVRAKICWWQLITIR